MLGVEITFPVMHNNILNRSNFIFDNDNFWNMYEVETISKAVQTSREELQICEKGRP